MHTCFPAVGVGTFTTELLSPFTAPVSADGTHSDTVPHPDPVSLHVVPLGQAVYPLLQHVASFQSMQPHVPSPGAHFWVQHVAVAVGHAVRFKAGSKPPHVSHPSGNADVVAVADRNSSDEIENFMMSLAW